MNEEFVAEKIQESFIASCDNEDAERSREEQGIEIKEVKEKD